MLIVDTISYSTSFDPVERFDSKYGALIYTQRLFFALYMNLCLSFDKRFHTFDQP